MLYIASDGAGYPLKNQIAIYLYNRGFSFADMGAENDSPRDYAPVARSVAQAVADSGGKDRAILVCGTGAGMSYAANRIRGIRCICCSEPATARLARLHNDANILAVGSRIVGAETAYDIVEAFLGTEFSGEERHIRRIAGIEG
ncbi:MAG: ribose 5-phosphate isomerase B [Oscillospiraceae bacterium]|jgi:ribose 5-phosphate isomerase B|nr:ribose 5-phosphate isomerase B [Oscillospiraceae bacterium]